MSLELLPEDQWSVSEAIADLQASTAQLTGLHDEDDLKRAFLAVRHASVMAYAQLDEAAKRARRIALAPYEKVA